MRTIPLPLLSAALLATGSIAHAADDTALTARPTAKVGTVLRGAGDARLGQITRILPDGSLQIILGDRFALVPASSLTTSADGKVSTTLSRRELGKR